jgi:hypothetical protein
VYIIESSLGEHERVDIGQRGDGQGLFDAGGTSRLLEWIVMEIYLLFLTRLSRKDAMMLESPLLRLLQWIRTTPSLTQ